MKKMSFDEYYLRQLPHVAARASCDRAHVGAIITRDNRQISAGYNGAPPGLPECDEVGHEMEFRSRAEPQPLFQYDGDHIRSDAEPGDFDLVMGYSKDDGTSHCVRTVHAEQNAIYTAARLGHATDGCTIYVSYTPCRTCAQGIISAGIKRVVVAQAYASSGPGLELLKLAGIRVDFQDSLDKVSQD